MAYELPSLPYPYAALEPYIDARTMEIHHTKHHGAYVTNLNKALENQAALAHKPIDQLLWEIDAVPSEIRQTVVNNGGGHANHSLFWQLMGPHQGGQPKGVLAQAISSAFASFDSFKEQFGKVALGRFGSGWAWLTFDPQGRLGIISTANQDSPLMQHHKPVLGLDVWEHAYYLKYQNRRADYIAAWWNAVNWDKVAEFFEQAKR
jgi:superoxide dismutase, Fe-Mn family